MSGAPRGRIARRVGALLVGLAAALGLGELAVRLATPTAPAILVRDAEIGARYLRSWTGEVYDAESGASVPLRFQRDGFRGPERPHAKPDGTLRIAVLGDSMIAAVAMAEPDTAVALLERRLNAEHPERRWEVMNFGVATSSLGQELLAYRQVVRAYAPDLVLGCFFTANDFGDLSRRIRHNDQAYFDLDERGALVQRTGGAPRSALSHFLNRHSRLYVWQKDLTRRARDVGAADAIPHKEKWIHCAVPDEITRHAWSLAEALLAANRTTVEADGARYALVLVPGAEQIHPEVFADLARRADVPGFEIDHSERRLAELCDRQGVPLLSLAPAFRAAAEQGAEQGAAADPLFYGDVGHFTERGNRVAAAGLYELLNSGGDASLVASLIAGL